MDLSLYMLDLSAAFASIDHHILLQRLELLIGINGPALSWFKSYSSDQFGFVHVNDKSSIYCRVSHWAPQSSVLGPVLLTIYILSLGNIINIILT